MNKILKSNDLANTFKAGKRHSNLLANNKNPSNANNNNLRFYGNQIH